MRFDLRVLGTSGAVPAYGRFCSAQLLRTETADFLIDCGEGCQMRLQEYGGGQARIHHIFISHLHGDHFYGLPGLLTSWALNDRTEPLTLFSPAGLYRMLDALLDLDRRAFPFPIEFVTLHTTRSDLILETDHLSVHTLPLHHGLPTTGFLFRERPRPANIRPEKIAAYQIPYQAIPAIKAGGDFSLPDGRIVPHAELTRPAAPPRSYAYCSDTRYRPALVPLIQGVDLLYHETTFLHELVDQAEETLHSTALEAARIAAAAEVGRLIMGHYSSRYPRTEVFEQEARPVFPNAHAAADGSLYEVPFQGRAATNHKPNH